MRQGDRLGPLGSRIVGEVLIVSNDRVAGVVDLLHRVAVCIVDDVKRPYEVCAMETARAVPAALLRTE